MLEFFGKKKKYNEGEGIPGAEKMAKIEVAHADEEGVTISGQDVYKGDNADLMQDNFKDNKVSEKSFHAGKRMSEDFGRTAYGMISLRSDQKDYTKYANDQKPIRKDKNKDWKEKEPFALDLPDEDEETPGEKHLNALAERYDDGDDFEEEHREAA